MSAYYLGVANINRGLDADLGSRADNTKREMLIVFPRLAVINKEEVTNEDREDAIAESAERFRLAEEARKEAERAAREAEEKERGEPEES